MAPHKGSKLQEALAAMDVTINTRLRCTEALVCRDAYLYVGCAGRINEEGNALLQRIRPVRVRALPRSARRRRVHKGA